MATTLSLVQSRSESLFEIDERLAELIDRAEEAAVEGGEIPQELTQEIDAYLEAFRTKIDRIAGYWRWQESIAEICGAEAGRLAARKKAAEGRLERLKGMLVAFMLSRGAKKLEGGKAAIGLQANSTASLIIDDPSRLGGEFFETSIRLTKTEAREIVSRLADGELRRRLEWALEGKAWEVNASAIRAALAVDPSLPGVRLVKGCHVRLR